MFKSHMLVYIEHDEPYVTNIKTQGSTVSVLFSFLTLNSFAILSFCKFQQVHYLRHLQAIIFATNALFTYLFEHLYNLALLFSVCFYHGNLNWIIHKTYGYLYVPLFPFACFHSLLLDRLSLKIRRTTYLHLKYLSDGKADMF